MPNNSHEYCIYGQLITEDNQKLQIEKVQYFWDIEGMECALYETRTK